MAWLKIPCSPENCGPYSSSSSTTVAAAVDRQAVEDGVRLSKESLKELFTALSPPGTVRSPRLPFSTRPDNDDDDDDHRRSVREWMEKKKVERMKEFRQKLQELRSAERHPFKPGNKMKQVHTCVVFLFSLIVLSISYHQWLACWTNDREIGVPVPLATGGRVATECQLLFPFGVGK